MLYHTDDNGVIITKYTVTGYSYKPLNNDRIELTLTTDKGNISFYLCGDTNATASNAMNTFINSKNTDIIFSLYRERNYIFLGSVDSISGNTIDLSLLLKITGHMIASNH